ncbi:MAG: alpha/beta hydrolase [Hyphomicrobiales bacterium]|nr:alpha/beta hydrolase [Hyphomicrobiales bacterium]
MSDHEQWQNFEYTSSDGLRLAGRKYGWQNRGRLAVVCLAGLTRNSADFHGLATHLSMHSKNPRRVLCLDYRGRGLSDYDENWQNYHPLVEGGDVVDGIIAAGLQDVAIVGTSRGGLIAMALSAIRPGIIKATVFNDVGPEIDATGVVRIKNYISNAKPPGSWREAREAVAAIGSKQFPRWDEEELDRQAQLIFNEVNGVIIRRYDDNLAKTLATINLDRPLPSFWPQFEGLSQLPVMLIRGDNSDMLSMETVEKMQRLHEGMELVNAPDQGHAPDLGNRSLSQSIARFITNAEKMSY